MKKLILLLSLFITNISTACDRVKINNSNVTFEGTPENPITGAEFEKVINSIPKKENIKSLYIYGVVTVPPNVLSNLPNLRIIRINGLPLNEITLAPGAFNNLLAITTIEIVNTNFLEDVLNTELPTLKKLAVINCNLTAIPNLNNFPNLTEVEFIDNPLTNLTALCQPHKSIKKFAFDRNQDGTSSKYNFILPDGAFNNWINLSNVVFNDAVIALEGVAFEGVPKSERPTPLPAISLNVHTCECLNNVGQQLTNLGLHHENICKLRADCNH